MTHERPDLIPLSGFHQLGEPEMVERSRAFFEMVRRRRTVRDFSSQPFPEDVLWNAIRAAGTAPNGANLQPWHFVVVRDESLKKQIREAAEIEEREFYTHRAPAEWLKALAPLGTDEHKPFLQTAPVLIAVFAKAYEILENGERVKNYYVAESVGIATGILITALHASGLATLTHTPSPMAFLNKLLGRPKNERPFLLLVVGYPAQDARVPRISKKSLDEMTSQK